MHEDLHTSDSDLPPPARTTLSGVILKLKEIARSKYSNKLYDHILPIYAELETSEKEIFLKGMIGICRVVEERVLVGSVNMNEVSSQVRRIGRDVKETIHSEVSDIEKINKIELIKLKSWMVKAGSVTVLVGLLGVLAIVVFLNHDNSEGILSNFDLFSTIGQVLKTALGL